MVQRRRRSYQALAAVVAVALPMAGVACGSFSPTDAPAAAAEGGLDDVAVLPTADGGDPDSGLAVPDGAPSLDAGCPAVPTAAASLLCAGQPCQAPTFVCCSNPDGGASMVCGLREECAAAALQRTRACGARAHCLGGQQHCCASALVVTATPQCPLLGKAADTEGFGTACEATPCAPAPELCAGSESCGSGSACLPVSVVLEGTSTIIGVCRAL